MIGLVKYWFRFWINVWLCLFTGILVFLGPCAVYKVVDPFNPGRKEAKAGVLTPAHYSQDVDSHR